MEENFIIREKINKDKGPIVSLMSKLKSYFSQPTIEYVRKHINEHQGYVVEIEGNFIGFLSYLMENGKKARISWLAVEPKFQSNGLGKRLLDRLEEDLKLKEIETIRVSTLGDNPDYPHFKRTRQFYKNNGYYRIGSYRDNGVLIVILEKEI